MGAAALQPDAKKQERAELIALTVQGCQLAKSAVSNAAEVLVHGSAAALQSIQRSEEALDELDRALDRHIALAVSQASPEGARELLACMKLMIDLERIGDLALNFATCAHAVRQWVDMGDIEDLIKMTCVLEKMLSDAMLAFCHRDVECALGVLRMDVVIDRLRNLLFARHTENSDGSSGKERMQVLLMAQALERAGDHAKNLAEEVCHLVTGKTIRHLVRSQNKSQEQMYLLWLKQRVGLEKNQSAAEAKPQPDKSAGQ